MKTAQWSHEDFLKRVNRLRLALLCVWFGVTFCVAYFARDFNFLWFERPLGFWMAAQGSVLVFLIIVWVYALWVNHWEKQVIGFNAEPDLEE
jgi:putative solute:sodium symporter small subunit